jgi:hypothetical protein
VICPLGDRCGEVRALARVGRKAGCVPCTEASRAYEKRRAYEHATKGHAYADAAPAREHLLKLARTGAGAGVTGGRGGYWFLAPAKTLGLSSGQLRRIMTGEIRRVRPETLSKILSLSLDDHDTTGRVRDRVTFEVLKAALREKGWTQVGISRALVDLGAARQDATGGTAQLTARGVTVRKVRLDAMRALLAHDRPPEKYVTPPSGGWDAWWNRRPEHDGRRHHTRRGCRRRGCQQMECVDANRVYQAACREGTDVVDTLVTAAAERHRLRDRDRLRQAELRGRPAA